MADIAFNWPEMEQNLLDPEVSKEYLKASKADFSKCKERHPENIWIFRKKDHKYWVFGRLTVDANNSLRPKKVKTSEHWINYIPNKSDFFMPPIEVKIESKEAPAKLFREMFGNKRNGRGPSALLLIENPDATKIKSFCRDFKTINFFEFLSQLSSGNIKDTPFKLSKVKNTSKQSSKKSDVLIQPNSNGIAIDPRVNNNLTGLENESNDNCFSNSESSVDSVDCELVESEEAILSDLMEAVENLLSESSNIVGEDIGVIAKRRIGQGPFRRLLEMKCGGKCIISEVCKSDLLIASHIKPWSKSDKAEKVDPDNGLLLSVIWDSVFDKGLVTFNEKGEVIISDEFDEYSAKVFGITKDARIPEQMMNDKRRANLEYHRQNIFRGAEKQEK